MRRGPGPGLRPGLARLGRGFGPVRDVVPVRWLRDGGRECRERPLRVEQLVEQRVGHGPPGAAGRAHQLRLAEPGNDVGDLRYPVSRASSTAACQARSPGHPASGEHAGAGGRGGRRGAGATEKNLGAVE